MKTKILFLGVFLAIIVSCHKNKTAIDLNTSFSNLQQVPDSEVSNTTTKNFADSSKTVDVNYFVEKINNTNGLSNSSVNAIFQDSENLLWIGTWDGLNRYDGNKFKIYSPELNQENSLSNQVILKIGEDNLGAIWVAGKDHLYKLEYEEWIDFNTRFYPFSPRILVYDNPRHENYILEKIREFGKIPFKLG